MLPDLSIEGNRGDCFYGSLDYVVLLGEGEEMRKNLVIGRESLLCLKELDLQVSEFRAGGFELDDVSRGLAFSKRVTSFVLFGVLNQKLLQAIDFSCFGFDLCFQSLNL